MDDHAEHMIKCLKLGRGPAHYAVKTATLRVSREIARLSASEISDEPSLELYVKEKATPENTTLSAAEESQGSSSTGMASRRKTTREAGESKTRADIAVYDRIKRQTVFIDVRTCAMLNPANTQEIGQTVHKGEQDKRSHYSRLYSFPEGVTFVPFTIDSYGRWGPSNADYLKAWCKTATFGNTGLYNRLITRARDWIAVANARAIGNRINEGLTRCLNDEAQIYSARKDF
jgi:hypothetical protein